MKHLTKIQKILTGILVLAAGVFAVLAVKEYNTEKAVVENAANSVMVSHESGYYETAIQLEFSGENITDIYYTTDGSDPSRHNPVAIQYSEPIYMPSTETESVYAIRALAYFEDGSISEVINRTFVLSEYVEERFDVPVLAVTGTEEFFFGEEYGRMTSREGKVTHGREWEEEVFMTLFDENGKEVLAQNCGFRLFGNFSREKNQRSFRLFGRLEYDEQNEFDYAFFDNQFAEDNTLVSEFKRIDVRNSGQDNGFALIRGELATRLAVDAGYPDVPCAQPVAVYVNSRYYGFYWLITNYNETYYENTYGLYDGTMYTFVGNIKELYLDEDETDEVYISLANEYKDKIAYFGNVDLTQEENWQELNDYLDVENFLQYVAIHHYIGNTDSFFNNYKIYRYVAPEGGEYKEGTVFDGKYRFILFDLDWGFAFQGGSFQTHVEDMTTTDRMTTDSLDYRFFQNLLKREDCRDYYIRYILSMQNYYYSAEYAGAVMDEMHASRAQELRYMYTTTDLLRDNFLAPDITCDEDVEKEMDRIRDFMERRPEYTTLDMSASFGPFTTYDLIVQNTSRANLTLDAIHMNEEEWDGLYYKELELDVSAKAKPGYRFDYWMINGEKYEEASFIITEEMITGDTVTIECVCSPDPEADFCITAIKTRGNGDYIELTNLSAETRSMSGYYLTDNETWNKSPLPGISIEAGATVRIYCENYTGMEALGEPCVNFDLKEGETLSLYRNGQVQLQTINVPGLGTEDGIFKMDMETGEFWEVRAEEF